MPDSADDPLSLAQHLCTRLCHDLAGPIGAVAAGVELTSGDPTQVDAETLGLIGSSSIAATRKLKFLRAALGVPGAPSAMLGELGSLTEGYLSATAGRNGPPRVEWPAASDMAEVARVLGASAVPVVLNLCLLVLEAQPACRRLRVHVATGPLSIVVAAEGDGQRMVEWRPEIAAIFNARPDAPSAKTIQAHLLQALARRAGGKVLLETQPAAVQARFFVP